MTLEDCLKIEEVMIGHYLPMVLKIVSEVLQTIQRTTKCERRQLGRSVAHACQVLMDLKCQESILECAGK